MTIPIRQSTASQEIPLGYLLDSTDGNTEETGLTIANTDIKLWKHGATTLANKNSGGATHISNGIYYCVLDATDSNTLGGLVIFVHVAGALAIKVECEVMTANRFDALVLGTDVLHADVTQWLGTAAAAPTVAGVPEVDITHLLGTAWLAPGVAGTPDVNAKLLGGTAQTGRDIGASVLLSTGTGAGQLAFTSGIVKSNLTQILSHLLTQTGTQLADGFEKFFDVSTPTGTVNSLPGAAADAGGGLPISDAGGLDLDTKLANTNEITAARMGALTDWINGGRLDLILDIIAADTSTTLNDMIERVLGISQENFYIDSTVFTGANMTSCRIRIYSVAGSVGTASDVIATYTMTTTYAGDNLASYKMVKA